MAESIGKRITGWFRDLFLENLFFKAIASIPILGSAMTSYLGISEGIPWAYVWTTTSLTFFGLAGGLLMVSLLKGQFTVKDRLNFHSLDVIGVAGTDGFSLRLNLVSMAPFAIEFLVEECAPILEGLTRLNSSMPLETAMIPPTGTAYFDCGQIAGTSAEERAGKVLNGTYSAKIKYGKIGKISEVLILKKRISVQFNEDGTFTGISVYDSMGAS